MAKVSVEVEVTKEAYELGQGLVDIIKAVKMALADGWQVGKDLPAIVASTVGNLGKMVDGIDQLDDEASEDLAAFAKALGLSVADAVAVLKKSA